ncbi:uncharacterized [Tachysurus ichikawai]
MIGSDLNKIPATPLLDGNVQRSIYDRGQFVEQVVAWVCGISGDLFGSLPHSAVMQLFDCGTARSRSEALALSPCI